MFAGKKDLSYFVAAVIPALQDGQFFAEPLDGLAAGSERFQRRAYAALHALLMGYRRDCRRRLLRLAGLRGKRLRLSSLLRRVRSFLLLFHYQMDRLGQLAAMEAE